MITASTSNSIQSDKPLTLTNQIGRELFTRFIDLKQNNLDSDPQLVQDVIDQTINNTTSGAAQAKQYSLTNISTLNQPTNTNYHDYGNNVATILLSDMPKIDAPTIASNAFDANDLSLLSEIDPLISAYQKVINNLLIIKTPQSIAQYHIDMINSISNLLFVSQELRNIEGDPAQSIVALEDYTTAQDSLKASLLGIKNTLQNKTSFTSIEPGTLFNTITP